MARPRRLRCPICRAWVAADAPEFPFCSQRCRTRDLANWAEGRYVIPVAAVDGEDEESATPVSDPDEE